MVIIPSSRVTWMSSFLTAGNSARMRNSLSVSLMSAEGAQSSFLPSPRASLCKLAKLGVIGLNRLSISLNGVQRMRLMVASPLVMVRISRPHDSDANPRQLRSEELPSGSDGADRPAGGGGPPFHAPGVRGEGAGNNL